MANREQIEHWNRNAGPTWVSYQEQLDAQIQPHGRLGLEALALRGGEHVLDIGCGCGDSTLEIAARVGPEGLAVGMDISAPMLGRARERAAAAGLEQVRFVEADVQTAALGEESYDAASSRFGVMFFEDPGAAFANLCTALRPGGRLAFVCWRPPQDNPWILLPMGAVSGLLELPPPPPAGAPGMFSLADPERIRRLLGEAGFDDVAVEGLELEMTPAGGRLERAAELFLEVGPVAALLREQGADEALRARVAEAVRAAYAGHEREGRLALGSAVWRVTARRPA